MTALNTITSFPVVLMLGMLVWGFMPIALKWESTPARSFAAMVVFIATGFMIRTTYWDVLSRVLPENAWMALQERLSGVEVNTIFNVLVAFGAYWGLHALYLTIPEDKREGYSVLTSWLYPRRLWRK